MYLGLDSKQATANIPPPQTGGGLGAAVSKGGSAINDYVLQNMGLGDIVTRGGPALDLVTGAAKNGIDLDAFKAISGAAGINPFTGPQQLSTYDLFGVNAPNDPRNSMGFMGPGSFNPSNFFDPNFMLNQQLAGMVGNQSLSNPFGTPFPTSQWTYGDGYWSNSGAHAPLTAEQREAQRPKFDFAGNPLGPGQQVYTTAGTNSRNPIQGSVYAPPGESPVTNFMGRSAFNPSGGSPMGSLGQLGALQPATGKMGYTGNPFAMGGNSNFSSMLGMLGGQGGRPYATGQQGMLGMLGGANNNLPGLAEILQAVGFKPPVGAQMKHGGLR